MFSPHTYTVLALLSLELLVDLFHQELAVNKLGLGPDPNLKSERENSDCQAS